MHFHFLDNSHIHFPNQIPLIIPADLAIVYKISTSCRNNSFLAIQIHASLKLYNLRDWQFLFFLICFLQFFNWMFPPSSSFHALLIGSSLMNTFNYHSFDLLCFQSVLTFRTSGFSTFAYTFLLSKKIIIVRLVTPCSIGSFFSPAPHFAR